MFLWRWILNYHHLGSIYLLCSIWLTIMISQIPRYLFYWDLYFYLENWGWLIFKFVYDSYATIKRFFSFVNELLSYYKYWWIFINLNESREVMSFKISSAQFSMNYVYPIFYISYKNHYLVSLTAVFILFVRIKGSLLCIGL